jgi:dTDP-4-dehydrorhamnose reductase
LVEASFVRILVLGRSGQLARALKQLESSDVRIECAGRTQLDLTQTSAIAQYIKDGAPDAVINAAAFTHVDAAESAGHELHALNALAPAAVAAACRDLAARFIHISSDYVFDGHKRGPYQPNDPVAPLNAYGRSKAAGEALVQSENPDAIIVRTTWVFASEGANFLRTMLRLAETQPTLRVVDDQIGAPTWAADLAAACLSAARAHEGGGIYHYTGQGAASWADFAEAIFEEAAQRGLPAARVERITSQEFASPTKRPANSRLDSSAFAARFGYPPRLWREALTLCMDEIAPRR